MKAIETIYNGYKFRSRLEARWAVFFDTLGVPYEYEKEGYSITSWENGKDVETRYLPDFWLPKQECWFEVKGDEKAIKENYDLFQSFSGQVGPLVVFTNTDANKPGTKFVLCDHDSNGGFSVDDIIWYHCKEHGFQLALHCSYRCTVFTHGYDSTVGVCANCSDPRHENHIFHHPQLIAAYTAARQARFEFGR
jgi:hypothetical protein